MHVTSVPAKHSSASLPLLLLPKGLLGTGAWGHTQPAGTCGPRGGLGRGAAQEWGGGALLKPMLNLAHQGCGDVLGTWRNRSQGPAWPNARCWRNRDGLARVRTVLWGRVHLPAVLLALLRGMAECGLHPEAFESKGCQRRSGLDSFRLMGLPAL